MGGPRAVLRRLPGVAGAGLAGWTVDVTVLWVGHTVFGVLTPIAAAAGFVASGIVNYCLNRLVFTRHLPGATHRADTGRLRRYGTLFAANLLIVTVSVPLLADALSGVAAGVAAPLLAAKIFVTALLLPVNTLLYGAWVFPSVTDHSPVAGEEPVTDQKPVTGPDGSDRALVDRGPTTQRTGGGR